MKRAGLAVLMVLTSVAALAADQDDDKKQDYSKPTILRILHERDVEQAPFRFDAGMLQMSTRSTRYHLAWLPFLAPLPYSYPRHTMEVPNPFVLTGTDIPYVPPPKADNDH